MFVMLLVALAATAPGSDVPAVRAQADLAIYIGTSDYPVRAQLNGEQGTVGFELSVAPDGRVLLNSWIHEV